jgi:hypothetical protein
VYHKTIFNKVAEDQEQFGNINYQIAEAFLSCCGLLDVTAGLYGASRNVTEVSSGSVRAKIIKYLITKLGSIKRLNQILSENI